MFKSFKRIKSKLYSAKVCICIFISVSECLFLCVCLSFCLYSYNSFLGLGGGVGGRVCVSAPWSMCVFSLPLIVFLPFCLSALFSVSSFPLIIHNTEKLKHISDYLLYFIWCYGVLTWKKLYRYFNIPLLFDRCCGFAVNYWQNRDQSLSLLLLGEFHALSTIFCYLLFYIS